MYVIGYKEVILFIKDTYRVLINKEKTA
jgi:hypothetical protein